MQRYGNSELVYWLLVTSSRSRDLSWYHREDNHFIESGYRAASGSLLECLYSWTYIHNETGTSFTTRPSSENQLTFVFTANIYLHLVGAAIFFALPLCLFWEEIPPRYAKATKVDIVVCLIYFFGVAICFSLSAMLDAPFSQC